MRVKWKKSQRAVRSPRTVGTSWAIIREGFRGVGQRLSLNSFWWPQWTTTARVSVWDQDKPYPCERVWGSRLMPSWQKYFQEGLTTSFTSLGCCFILLTLFIWNARWPFRMLYGNSTHFLQPSVMDYGFFAAELIRYDVRFYFKPALCVYFHCH